MDSETGLVYFRNRMYSPAQGRFLQRDPLGYVDGLGLHEAMGGRPGEVRDPMGLDYKMQKELIAKYERLASSLPDEQSKKQLEEKMFGQLEIAFHYSPGREYTSVLHGEVFIGDTSYGFYDMSDGGGTIVTGLAGSTPDSKAVLAPNLSAHTKHLILQRAVEVAKLSEDPSNRDKGMLWYRFGFWHCNNVALWILDPVMNQYPGIPVLMRGGQNPRYEYLPAYEKWLLTAPETEYLLTKYANFQDVSKEKLTEIYNKQREILQEIVK